MNNKAKIYLAAHRKSLDLFTEPPRQINQNTNNKSEVGSLYLEIAHLYIKDVSSDESNYWITFVFDTCASLGLCSERYISHLTPEQKRDYIIKTLESRIGGEVELNNQLVIDKICELISKFSEDERSNQTPQKKVVANAILDFIHVLISIDRSIDNAERNFFRDIRDGVYAEMEWSSPVLENATNCGTQKSNHNTVNKSNASLENLLNRIDELIGLSSIKEEVSSLVNTIRVKQLRSSAGLPNPDISYHMVFYGNPGTGKTTVARILGEIYALLGVLSKGHFVETDRSGLVGGYLGQTALKTKEVLESALGGILFIDEAYSLSSLDGNDQYGQEAIETILKYMEDHRNDIVVIAAGYQDQMNRFVQSNPGLKSRFNKFLEFHDYTDAELLQIFLRISSDAGYFVDSGAIERANEVIRKLLIAKSEYFGNGRTMRNLFENTIANQANRLVQTGVTEKKELAILMKEDIPYDIKQGFD